PGHSFANRFFLRGVQHGSVSGPDREGRRHPQVQGARLCVRWRPGAQLDYLPPVESRVPASTYRPLETESKPTTFKLPAVGDRLQINTDSAKLNITNKTLIRCFRARNTVVPG